MAGTGAFVGREGELSRLRSALAERARLVLVVGDAGIGKTRFVEEGLRRAAADGMVVISGGCLPLAEKLPLLPLADALARWTRRAGGRRLAAARDAAPAYVRPEVARLLPRLALGEPSVVERVEAWRHERLFAAIGELLSGVARRSAMVLLVEDVQWADTATLDCLTYLVRASRDTAATVLVTFRSDETPLDGAVADWLTHVRRDAGVQEIRLRALSRGEVVKQVTALAESPPPAALVAEVYARAEGHPFFTEQLVAAAISESGQLVQPVALPARLAELLVARAARCGADARSVLSTLAIAGRPLSESLLSEVSGLEADAVRTAVRELGATRLLAAPSEGGHAPRHALLAEAVAAELLPGERLSLHQRLARALQAAGGDSLAAEAAGHWAAAGRSGEELWARLTAAEVAEQMFAYADAAAHWQRAIELCQTESGADVGGEAVDVVRLYILAVDALEASGDGVRAGALAEEAYRRFAHHPDRATAGTIHLRAAVYRGIDSQAAGLSLIREALRLFEGTPPSFEHAMAWLRYSNDFLLHGQRAGSDEALASLNRALEIAEAADAATLIPQILCLLALESFVRGDVQEGFRLLAHARSEPESRDAWAMISLAIVESDVLLKVGRLKAATKVGLRGFEDARQLGVENTFSAAISLSNAVEGLLGRGCTVEAAALIDSRASGPVDRDHWPLHQARAEIDLLRGELDSAAQRLGSIETGASSEFVRDFEQDVAEVALWAGRPEEALKAVQRALDLQEDTKGVILCGWLLAMGMRACGDLAERARALRDPDAGRAALTAADKLVSWVRREHDVPFTDHPFVAAIPCARATWDAEHGRAAGANDPAEWSIAAERWETLGYGHRVAYARWRQAEALLALGTPDGRGSAAMVLSLAARHAQHHVPLMRAVEDLARRARIDLTTALAEQHEQEEPQAARPFGLTDRELDVLRLLGLGRTNPEIAAALFISPRTVGVHVTHILRKLHATTRVQAATVAERAGLLAPEPTHPGAT